MLFLALPLAAQPVPSWSPDEDILGHLEKQPDNSRFMAALKASGWDVTLRTPGRYTVFAPTNQAFAALPRALAAALVDPRQRDRIRALVGCHIVGREVKFGLGPDGTQVIRTLGGCTLRLTRKGLDIRVTDENGITAKLRMFDVFEANGQIEVIDAVLTPKLPAGAS
ncbi:fasciclin domain-containing protein [Sandaracinobacteroides saxicola]|nr:fasciclin domain-containing protein [Sandaracinobacteroides saxicola]